MKSITLMIIKLLKFMKIDNLKLIEVIQKIFKTKKIKKIDHLKLGSLMELIFVKSSFESFMLNSFSISNKKLKFPKESHLFKEPNLR